MSLLSKSFTVRLNEGLKIIPNIYINIFLTPPQYSLKFFSYWLFVFNPLCPIKKVLGLRALFLVHMMF